VRTFELDGKTLNFYRCIIDNCYSSRYSASMRGVGRQYD
jgi:hypothetical protein